MRKATVRRETAETSVEVTLNLDGSGQHTIATGIGFLDHLLVHVAVHGLFDLQVQAGGDLHVDPHHTVEDVALVLGQALDQALDERRGIVRMGAAWVPMDEALASVAIDLSGRRCAVTQMAWNAPSVGGLPVTLIAHFFRSLAETARATVHARVHYGEDDHHCAEALFKALGRALDTASRLDPRRADGIPSTKGVL
jgi:imidazoleglycerol-phosphate dehydratase